MNVQPSNRDDPIGNGEAMQVYRSCEVDGCRQRAIPVYPKQVSFDCDCRRCLAPELASNGAILEDAAGARTNDLDLLAASIGREVVGIAVGVAAVVLVFENDAVEVVLNGVAETEAT